jgi:hypothetical protein
MSQPEDASRLSPDSRRESENQLLKLLSIENFDADSCYERDSALEGLEPEWREQEKAKDF